MLFSILIAHYNNWDYFQDCYKSILAQTHQDFEIIIVDDCSTDDSFEKLKELSKSDLKIKLFQNPENKGVGFTKRKCIEMASGEICGFVDPDDAITENAIEESIKHYTSSEVVATYSQIMMCDEGLNQQNVYHRTRKIKNGQRYFFNIFNEVSHFFTFRKGAYLDTEGINENLSSAVDFDLYLKLYEKGKFIYVKDPLYIYRQHQGGVSQDNKKKKQTYENWNKVLYDTCQRRNISELYGERISENSNLPELIFRNQNKLMAKVKRFICR